MNEEKVTPTQADNPSRPCQILAISGSLRQVSSNTTLLQAAIFLARDFPNALSPAHLEMKLYGGLGDLPHFNPDLEPHEPPAVKELRSYISWADGLIISSPEYAHGVPGVLKNALDWLVSSAEFINKPVAFFNASPRAVHAPAALAEIVTTMAGKVVPAASITVALPGRNLDIAGIVADPEISREIRSAITALVVAIQSMPD